MPKRKAAPEPCLPDYKADHARMDEMRLRVISYQHCSPVGGWYVPRDIVGADGKTVILWRTKSDGEYSIDGWEPWHDGMFGGRREHLSSALYWVQRARDVRAGTAADFLGC